MTDEDLETLIEMLAHAAEKGGAANYATILIDTRLAEMSAHELLVVFREAKAYRDARNPRPGAHPGP